MVAKQALFNGVTNGTAFTVAGGTGDDAFTANTMAGAGIATASYAAVAAAPSTHGVRCNAVSADTFRVYHLFTSDRIGRLCEYVTLGATPGATVDWRMLVEAVSFGQRFTLRLNTARQLLVLNAAGTVVKTFTTALTVATRYRIEAVCTLAAAPTTSNGAVWVAFYVGESATPVEAVYDVTNANLGTGTGFVRWQGWKLSTGGALDLTVDTVRADIGTVATPFGAYGAVVANAGVDQTVEAASLVDLAAQDTDARVTSFAWTQTGGTAVTINNAATADASFTAPLATTNSTLTFQLSINGGVSTDSVTVTVLKTPVTQKVSGTWQPRVLRVLT